MHPDVRRMLMTIRAYTEGCRAFGGWVAQQLDVVARSADPAAREEAEDFTALMTPIVKALFTDIGFEMASMGMQVYGGHGYIRDHGMEQYVRDARISMIYEGTNGIQALDLVGRKMPANMGRSLRRFFHPVQRVHRGAPGPCADRPQVRALERAFGALQLATAHIATAAMKDAEEAGAAATDYLRLFGLVALGFMWVRSAEDRASQAADGQRRRRFYQAKLHTAQFFMDRLLPQAGSLYLAIKSGKGAMMAMDEAAF